MRQYFFKKGGTIPVTARKRKRGDDYIVLSKFSNYIFRHTVNNTIAARFSERSEQNKKRPQKTAQELVVSPDAAARLRSTASLPNL